MNLFNLGSLGVQLTKSKIHADDGSFRSTQNALPDTRGEFGGLAKRDGLVAINSTTAGGSVRGIIDIPFPAVAKYFIGSDDVSQLHYGWGTSTNAFTGTGALIEEGVPADPRGAVKLNDMTPVNVLRLGKPFCVLNNRIYYAANDYTVGTDAPPIRVFDGATQTDREVCKLPANPDVGTTPCKAVVSMTTFRGTIYVATFDAGTSSADFKASVYSLDPHTGVLTKMGTTFPTGYVPHAMVSYLGRIWIGTISGDTSFAGKVYWFRPGVDTSWTLDHTTTAGQGEVNDLCVYKGKLYAAVQGSNTKAGLVLVRSTAGVWSTSQTGAATNLWQGYVSLCVFGANLYAAYKNATAAASTIQKFDNSTWSTVYTSSTVTTQYVLYEFGGVLWAVDISQPGGSNGGELLSSADGSSYTDRSGFNETYSNTPIFAVVGV